MPASKGCVGTTFGAEVEVAKVPPSLSTSIYGGPSIAGVAVVEEDRGSDGCATENISTCGLEVVVLVGGSLNSHQPLSNSHPVSSEPLSSVQIMKNLHLYRYTKIIN